MRISLLVLVPMLLLAGCSRQNYVSKLKLAPLPEPEVLAPVETVTDAQLGPAYKAIETALTPSQADAAVTQIRQGSAMLLWLSGMANNTNVTPEIKAKRQAMMDEMNRVIAYLEQAGQIKRAQLEDGDSSDSTGEVTERLLYTRQGTANMYKLAKDIPDTPATAPGVAPAPAAASAPGAAGGAAGPLLDGERAWVRNCEDMLGNLRPLAPNETTLDDLYLHAARDWGGAKDQYERGVVPSRFSGADALFRQAFAKSAQGLPLLDQARRENSNSIALQGVDFYKEAYELIGKGLDEVRAAAK
ncbi:hypothetical protein EON83_28440 [bacterium]|nr:MAG: hypothetical protein EON83_28440 [bacterium]